MAMAIDRMKKATTPKAQPNHSSNGLLLENARTMKKKAMLETPTNGTSVMKEKVRRKNTGLATRTRAAIRLSVRARPSSRSVPYRARAPSQVSITVETLSAANENPKGKQNRAPQRIWAKG